MNISVALNVFHPWWNAQLIMEYMSNIINLRNIIKWLEVLGK
jgi:hypothetical protein